MNRRPPVLVISKAVVGFLQYKQAEGLSPRTVDSYSSDLKLWLEFQEDVDVNKVSAQNVRQYLTFLLNDYVPRRITGNNHIKLSPKTVHNVWITLCAFFHWVSDEFEIPNIMKSVPGPKFQEPPVEPFSKEEVEALLKACDYCREAQTERRHKFTMRRPSGFRDRALILMLLDTGLRASELCSLLIEDMDMNTGKVTVKHGVAGGAKGKKGRIVYMGKVTRKSIWRYLANREDGEDPKAPLFIGKYNHTLNRDTLRQIINSLGEKAQVKKCYPHRFRHTMAIRYLRAGGDLFTLQALLGHSSLEVVQIYAKISGMDIEQMHSKASPADNWHL